MERVGKAPVKQIADGELRVDSDKAVRCCVDWAIKEYGAEADGTLGGKKDD